MKEYRQNTSKWGSWLTIGLLVTSLSWAQTETGKKADETKPEATETKTEPAAETKAEPKADAKPKADKKKSSKESAKESAKSTKKKEKKVIMETSAGTIELKLFPADAPKTVENFIGLATGTKEWTDPSGKKVTGKSLYEGTIFHRIIPGFMIQGGDPKGDGTGGPGYRFEDETNTKVFDKPGILAMANAGPNTNGSQFFITDGPAAWLNGHHTIFGEVTKGMDIVKKIIGAPRGPNDRPNTPIKIVKITVK